MTDEILGDRAVEYFVSDWKMIPDSGGKFEFYINDELVYSKKQLGRHAEPGEIKAILQEKIDAYKLEQGINWDHLPQDDDD